MSEPGVERLRRVLGGEDLAWLIERVRNRMVRGEAITGVITRSGATPAQRRAVEQLLGRPPGRGASLTVSLDDLDALLRGKSLADGLADAMKLLHGRILPAAVVAAASQAAWDQALTPLAAAVHTRSDLQAWYEQPRNQGLIRRLLGAPAGAAPVLDQLAAVLVALPAPGVTMATFAATATGDAHALDAGNPLATLAESAIRATWLADSPHPGSTAQRRRALWDAVGVLIDDLSSTVLILNLISAAESHLHRFTGPAREAGEPLVLTLRQLARHPLRFAGTQVFVCENPAVIADAADELGAACPPLICVNGQPSGAALRLLSALHDSGARLRYHGDFDWGGLRIANLLHSRLPWQPWRFDTDAYLTAVSRARRPLRGRPTIAAWDPTLAGAISDAGLSVDEELVIGDLLADLRSSAANGL